MQSRTHHLSGRQRAQNLVEYGLLVAVMGIVFIAGMTVIMNGQASYMSSIQKPVPTAVSGLPSYMERWLCSPPQPLVYTGHAFNCTLTVTDQFTGGPAIVPVGSIAFSGSGTFSACPLQQLSSSSSGCNYSFTPTNTQYQSITAVYTPISNHWTNQWELTQSIYALDLTHIDPSSTKCVTPVPLPLPLPLGEPARCTAAVYDEFTNQLIPNATIWLSTSTPPGGTVTYSPFGSLSETAGPTYPCATGSGVLCQTVFRSGATAQDQGTFQITPSFVGDADHESAPAFLPWLSM